ncbi:MAG: hypothetical protein IJ272_05810 [Clostridia bacterium]|nr:hypothetical protein [Clostridia bacterium]
MKIKALIKSKIKGKELLNKSKDKRGSELAQTILITAIMVVVIVTLFFPQIQSIFSTSMSKLSGWFNTVLNTI